MGIRIMTCDRKETFGFKVQKTQRFVLQFGSHLPFSQNKFSKQIKTRCQRFAFIYGFTEMFYFNLQITNRYLSIFFS